jgi:ADP-ribose pyrophosphatase YjhB (NUDIX family)
MKKLNFKEFDRGLFVVNVLGIVLDPKTKKILIGRRENDPYIKKLTWCFPGGGPTYHDELEEYLKIEIKKKTEINVKVEKIMFAKTYPEDRRFLSIYYLCSAKMGNEKAGDKFVELKWVKPSDVKKYFTTSLHPELLKYLRTLS